MDAKQFAWLYLIKKGIAGVKFGYYGGNEFTKNHKRYFGKLKFTEWETEKVNKAYLTEIVTHGINWDQTSEPESQGDSFFVSTFEENEWREYLTGTLVLNNGYKLDYVLDERVNIDMIHSMLSACSSLIENVSVEEELKKLL